MPKREEDPSLLGTIIEFDPIQEQRRYQEEEEQRKSAKKRLRKLKKDDSSKCSGATASTSKSNNSSTPVPDKIVATIISEETEEDAKSSCSSRENKKDEKKKKAKSERRSNNLRKCKSEHDLTKKDLKKDLKKAKSKKSIKKQEKRQRRAARNIQRIARGYLVRRDLEEEEEQQQRQQQRQEEEEEEEEAEQDAFDYDDDEASAEQRETASLPAVERRAVLVEDASDDETSCEEQEVEEPITLSAPLPGETEIEAGSEAGAAAATTTTPNNNNNNNKTPRRLGARIRQAIKRTRTPRKEAAASRLQHAFRLFQVRRLFQKGDKQRWRTAWQRFFVFSVFSPLERMRQKQRLMQGPAVPPNQREESEQEFDVSDSTTDQDLDIIPLSFGPTSPVAKGQDKEQQEQEPDLLDAIPEDKAHCERVVVNHLLAPLPSFADSDCSINSEDLMSDMVSPASPSTVTSHFSAGSLTPRRVVVNASKKSKPVSFHSSCPVLRFDTV